MPYACVYIFLAFVFHRGTLRVAKRAAEYIYLKNDPDSWVPFQNTKWRIKYTICFKVSKQVSNSLSLLLVELIWWNTNILSSWNLGCYQISHLYVSLPGAKLLEKEFTRSLRAFRAFANWLMIMCHMYTLAIIVTFNQIANSSVSFSGPDFFYRLVPNFLKKLDLVGLAKKQKRLPIKPTFKCPFLSTYLWE